jgi:hypothetical protein
MRQVEEHPRGLDRHPTGGVEAEEIDAGPIFHSDVRPNVELGEL